MTIPFVENDVSETLALLIEPEDIMTLLRDNNQLQNHSLDYAEACYDMCNIFTFIIGNKINPFCEPQTLMVHEGNFGMIGNHTWLVIEDTIIDATLLQFNDNASKINYIDSSFTEYHSVKKYTFEDWVENSPNLFD